VGKALKIVCIVFLLLLLAVDWSAVASLSGERTIDEQSEQHEGKHTGPKEHCAIKWLLVVAQGQRNHAWRLALFNPRLALLPLHCVLHEDFLLGLGTVV
jgi:hypothetical protein